MGIISRRAVVLCVMFGLSLLWSAPTIAVDASPTRDTKTSSAQAGQGLNLIKSDEESIVLELYTPAYQVQEKKIDGVVYHSLSIDSYGETSEVGQPQLPIEGVMLGVPPGAKFEVRVLETDSSVATERYNVYPVPKVVIREDPYGLESLQEPYSLSSKGIEYVFAKDEDVYSTNAFRPTDLVEVTSSGYIRDQRFVQLQLHPLQYNPVSQQLRFHKRMKVELRFVYNEGKATSAVGTGEIGGPFEGVIRNSLLNYELAKGWRSRATLSSVGIQGENPPASQLSWKIAVNEDGIYKVTYDDLSTEGFPSGVYSSTLKLFTEGSEAAIYVDDPEGSFGSGDYFLFYGQKMDTKYTDVNVYWLTWGGADGRRMVEQDGTPGGTAPVPSSFQTTRRVEEDHNYQSSHPSGPEDDRWYWNYIYAAGSPASASYTTTLQHIATAPLSATVRGLLKGHSATPQHHTRVYLNGHLVDDATWPPQAEYTFEESVPQSYLIEGTNTISVECPLDLGITLDIVLVNWFEIDYHDTYTAEGDSLFFAGDEAGTWEYHVDDFTTNDIEVFDITDPATPISITGEITSSYTLKFEDTITDRTEYLALTTAQRLSPVSIEQDAPSDLQLESNGADYIIITHSDFYTDVLPLANRRAAQGPRTIVVDVQDVYDEFSYGVFDPRAIKDFLAYAYANWVAPAPSYVLLVGDGNYDFKDNFGRGEPNYVPPYLADVDPWIGEVAAENRYVLFSGDDILPDMHIGRLPVQTSAQASTMVDNILNYEQNSSSGGWNKNILFVADNQDGAGDFDYLSDDIADNYLPSSYTAQKVYYKITHPTVDGVRTAVIDALNEGRLLANYIGHASNQFWASEKLFQISSIAALTNTERLPMMLPMTCLEGYFIEPSPPGFDASSLGESIVRASGGGAITSWSATGLGLASGHDYLSKGFFTAVFSDTISEIGQATYLGKLNLYDTGSNLDLMDTYVLFGDPFMKLNLPACDAADFDKDRQITVVDITQVAIRWASEWGDEDYDRKYDLDNDGEITVVDIMRVAAQWGNTCGAP